MGVKEHDVNVSFWTGCRHEADSHMRIEKYAIITVIYGRIAKIPASCRKLGSRNTIVTQLWARYHVPQNVFLVNIIRPHRRTTHVDAAYCYRPRPSVCQSVCLSLCLSVCHSIVSSTKTAEPIETPFGLWAWTGPRNHALDRVRIPIRGNFEGKGRHCKCRVFCHEPCRNG